MGGADTAVVDPKSIPASEGISVLISGQVGEYSQADKAGVPRAGDGFRFAYSRMMGWA